MATTNFVDGQTVISADWLNDVNEAVYNPASITLPATSVTTTAISGISATDVQGVLAEIVAEKQPLNTQLTTLAGITAQQASDIAALSTFIGTLLNDADAATARTTLGISPLPAGTIIDFAGTTAPTGFLACPLVETNISRTTYADLFAAIGTTWGVGDGTTTFGMPWFPADYAGVQANANVGTATVGQVIAHTHTIATDGAGSAIGSQANILPADTHNTGSTGGPANLAAGHRVLKCVKI